MVGEILKEEFENKSIEDIFKKIEQNDVNHNYASRMINVYKDPRIPENIRRQFFSAIYDYLKDFEKHT